MKPSLLFLTILLIFTLFSCRESWVKTKDTVPSKNYPDSLQNEKDTTNLFKDNPKENKPHSKRDVDTLKPKMALDLRLKKKLSEDNKS